MSEVHSKIPFDTTSGKYRNSWQTSQEEQVIFRSVKTNRPPIGCL